MRLKISPLSLRFFNALVPARQLLTAHSNKKITNINLNARLLSTNQGLDTNKEFKGRSAGQQTSTYIKYIERWGSEQSLVAYIEQLRAKGKTTLLDLSGYHFTMDIDAAFLADSPFIKTLSGCREVEVVDLSGHYDIKNLEFSRFRKLLPKLKSIILKDIEPDNLRITSDQIIKCYANNIVLHADSNLMKYITQEAMQFLIYYGQSKYAHSIQLGITVDNIDPRPFQEAFIAQELKRVAQEEERKATEIALKEQQKKMNLELLNNYKLGRDFNIESPWYIMGPKSEEDLGNCEYPHTILTLYAVITKLNCWEAVLNCSEPYIKAKELEPIFGHPATQSAIDTDGHSGRSFVSCMRFITRMAKDQIASNSIEITPSTR